MLNTIVHFYKIDDDFYSFVHVGQSIQDHAPYLNTVSRSKKKQLEEERLSTIIPKALSVEDLDISLLPVERPYMVLGSEQYTLQQRYFDQSSEPRRGESKTSLHFDEKDLEKELRTSYRIGHLDEIKKRQFGKIYNETRKLYMELERYDFLQEQTKRNTDHKQKMKKKAAEETRNVDKSFVSKSPQIVQRQPIAWKPVGNSSSSHLVTRHR